MSKAAGREGIPFRALVPNAVTALALCFGLTGVRFAVSAFEGNDAHWEIALACVIGAGVLDGMDGRIARLLRAQSRFGAELDSLSDVIAFGVAPALVMIPRSRSPSGTPRRSTGEVPRLQAVPASKKPKPSTGGSPITEPSTS